MDAMATWQDGPEYAPSARPDAFVSPDAAPLTSPPTASDTTIVPVAPGTPRPDYAPVPSDVPPLEGIAPPEPPRRDPREAFEVESTVTVAATLPTTPLTTTTPLTPLPTTTLPTTPAWAPPTGQPVSAWGSAHAPQAAPRPPADWAPQQPFRPLPAPPMHVPGPPAAWPPPQVNPSGFPPPQEPPWYRPAPGLPGPGPLQPVTLAQMAQATTPALLITLVIGGIVTPLALPLLLVGNVLGARVRFRRARVRLVFRVGFWAALGLGMVSAWWSLRSLDALVLWDHVNGWAQLACWAVAAVVMLVQGDALRRGEQPEPPA